MGSGQITKNWINFDLIEIIQFPLKIYDLWTHPHLWVVGSMGGLIGGSMAGFMSNHQIWNKS